MKHSKLILTFLIAALVTGCDKSSTSSDATASQQLDQAKQDTMQAVQDMKNYTYAQKEDFIKTMQAKLDELNVELAQLSAKIDHASDATKAAAQPKIDDLKAQVAALGVQLDQVKSSTESTWDQVKDSVQKGFDATKQAFTDAGTWIDKQVNS
jgi:predicted  nucleic acid-binding Zn-ribbon protein